MLRIRLSADIFLLKGKASVANSGNQTLHLEELRQFESLMRQMNMDRLGERLKVVDLFLNSEEHLSAKGWQDHLKGSGVDLELSFIAETLNLLTKLGLANQRRFMDGPSRYEHRHLNEHHDHLICTRCGSIKEFHHPQLEELQDRIVEQMGFHPLRHRLQVYGLCQKCLAARAPAMPLSLATAGERVRVERIGGGEKARKNLNDLGINVGTELVVISSNGGPLVVAVKGTRIALGRGAAQKVMVSQLKP